MESCTLYFCQILRATYLALPALKKVLHITYLAGEFSLLFLSTKSDILCDREV